MARSTRQKKHTAGLVRRPSAAAVLVLTTVPVGDRGEAIARALVEDHLAACVNLFPPMTSVYRWRGAVEQEAERQVVIKTSRSRVARLQARLLELHPYELPEFLVVTIDDGSRAYLEWLGDSVRIPL